MTFLRKIVVVSVMASFMWFVSAQSKPVQNQEVTQPSTTICSTMKRSPISTTLWSLFWSDPFMRSYLNKTSSISLNTAVQWWHPSWFNNDLDKKESGCQTNNADWWWVNEEVQWYNSFASNNSTVIKNYFSNYSIPSMGQVSQDKLRQIQSYITWACGISLKLDGKLWIKTLNAIKYCKPPALWYLSWSQFQAMYLKLYLDPQWTQSIYTGGQFKENPSQKLYFKQADFPSQQTSPWLWLVQTGSITNGTSAIAWTSSITDTSSTATCRFQPQAGVTPSIEYTTAVNNTNEYIVPTDACTNWCWNGYTEVKKWWIAICEKCDLKKCNCGIKLNTNIPFIGRCIMNQQTNNVWQSGDVMTVNSLNAFPILMWALIKLLMSIIMIVCFASLIVWWFMMTVPDQYDTGKWIVKKVIRTIVALWSLWTILYLINPNFFF